jgi:hypothetical protein
MPLRFTNIRLASVTLELCYRAGIGARREESQRRLDGKNCELGN